MKNPSKSNLFRDNISEPRVLWLLATGALFPPAILLFYYNQNSTYFPVLYVLIPSVLCVVLTAAFWLLGVRIFRRALAVTVFCLMIWFGIFVESLAHEKIADLFFHVAVFFCFWILMSGILAYVLRSIPNDGKFSLLLCSFFSVFFLMSAVSCTYITVTGSLSPKPEIKTDFIVEHRTDDRPNVYWIHCDGMLSVSAVEKYFGDPQDDFCEALRERSFLINETASFEARHKTTIAVPALMCPFFYDTRLKEMIDDPAFDTLTIHNQAEAILTDVRLNNELIDAFSSAGYDTNTVALMDQHFFPTTDSFYFPLDTIGCGHFTRCIALQYPYTLARLPQLSKEKAMKSIHASEAGVFMLSFFRPGTMLFGLDPGSPDALFPALPSYAEPVDPILTNEEIDALFMGGNASISHAYFAQALSYILNDSKENAPSFNMLMSVMFHDPYLFDANGNRKESFLLEDAKNYHDQHVYFSKVLIRMIDMILEKDPDAVIILQADHGMNTHYDWELDFSFGKGGYDLLELRNSTMSAIRIPEKHRNGEEIYTMITPLNLSRYLVNRFVGQNYAYLETNNPVTTVSDT
ncbi:MAG: hypothetical protein GXY43_00510 [Clostridiaceae bacterium]|nr:hypothetical protein [Clostridiaceae bacterium]